MLQQININTCENPPEVIDPTGSDEEKQEFVETTEQDTLMLEDSTIQETFMTGGNMDYASDTMTTQSSEMDTLPIDMPLSIEEEQGKWISGIRIT